MDAVRWQRIRAVFFEALERPPAERDAFIRAEAGGDDLLVLEVRSLLRADENVSRFLEAGPLGEPREEDAASRWLGQRFGAYEAVAVLGRGGMGTVLLGERADGRYRGRVAIKVLSGVIDHELIDRFRAEGQVLADLDHENIARLIDAGDSEDGLSYLIMEHVDGPRIDEWATASRLDVGERLDLFRGVLAGVAYAHSRGVIHRDLKPSNILVTADGRPKIVDFGIAKLLERGTIASTEPTRTRHLRMTPEYASPEQVRGERVDASSDVYSLGVVLYRLLTGRPPYEIGTTGPSDAERVICEQEPVRPSSAVADGIALRGRSVRELRGDLDAIILKALSKRPERRYATAAALADDIARYLDGRPVRARAPSLRRQVRSFVRRRRVAVGAVGVFVMMLAGLGWQSRMAAVASERASANSEALTELAESTLANMERVRAATAEVTSVREVALDAGLASLDRLVERLGGSPHPALLMTLARAYLMAAAVQGHPYEPNVGRTDQAEESYLVAIELLGRVITAAPDTPGAVGERERARMLLSDVLMTVGRSPEAHAQLDLARPVFDSIADENPNSPQVKWSALASGRTAVLRVRSGDFAVAESLYRSSLARIDAVSPEGLGPEDRDVFALTAVAHRVQLGDALQMLGRFGEAIEVGREAVTRAEVAVAAGIPSAALYLSDALYKLSGHLAAAGAHVEAVRTLDLQLEMLRPVAAADPANTQWPLRIALAHEVRALSRVRSGDWSDALDDASTAISMLDVLGLDYTTDVGFIAARARLVAGEALTGLERFAEADEELSAAVDQIGTLRDLDAAKGFAPIWLATAYRARATLHEARGATESGALDCRSAYAALATADSIVAGLRAASALSPGLEAMWSDVDRGRGTGPCPL